MFNFLNKSDRELEEELVRQLTIANTLKMLEIQYNSADSIMNVNEIREHYKKVYEEIFKEENNE